MPESQPFQSGILAETGDYALSATVEELYAEARAQLETSAPTRPRLETLGPPPSVRADDLAKSRWGVVWPPEPLTPAEEEHRAALASLLECRGAAMGKQPHEFHYRDGWSASEFLWEDAREVEVGRMNVDTVPYYLLLAGSPERIPWRFQQDLDEEYAVGRLSFTDPADCRAYVDHLVAHERQETAPKSRAAAFAATIHEGDAPTAASANDLVRPLHDWVAGRPELGFQTSLLIGAEPGREATKENLVHALTGDGGPHGSPAFLFTAGHGLEFGIPSAKQLAGQGALLCQDWPGPRRPPLPEQLLAGADVVPGTDLSGMVTFLFACFSAGSPREVDWVPRDLMPDRAAIADAPFVSLLPQKLLARGGLAVFGSASRAADYAFLGARRSSRQAEVFNEVVALLLSGQPVGHAMDYLNTLCTRLGSELGKLQDDPDDELLQQASRLWMTRHACRGHVLLGDPAARLRLAPP